MKPYSISIVGTGYVGLCTAIGFASKGYKTIASTHNREKATSITCTEREVFKIERGQFIVSMSSSVLSQEELKKIAEQILQLYLQRIKSSQL